MDSQSIPSEQKHSHAKQWTIVLLIIYLVSLFWIILFKLGVQFSYMEKRSVNLIPFVTLYYNKLEVLLNVLIFIPLGTYTATLLKNWKFAKQVFSFFMLSLLFESLQIILRIGTFDVTDLITNTVGGMFGIWLFQVIQKLLRDPKKAHLLINVFASLGTVLMVTFLVLLKLQMLPIRYQ